MFTEWSENVHFYTFQDNSENTIRDVGSMRNMCTYILNLQLQPEKCLYYYLKKNHPRRSNTSYIHVYLVI